MVDKFPAEQQRIVKGLQDAVDRLNTIARGVAPIKVNKASEYFDLPEASPAAPGSGVRLYSGGGKFTVKTSANKTVTIPMADVANPANFTSPSTQTGDFASASAYTQLRADCARLHDTVRDLQNAMRAAGLMG
ncbi:hypothetical protein [Microbispora sp. CA-102843]|uniref:hypothetical protein n=1 Tax=Microbispora sp. CA-102843 TaxID=3239952 RepID=UPI003D8EE111